MRQTALQEKARRLGSAGRKLPNYGQVSQLAYGAQMDTWTHCAHVDDGQHPA